jgi:hypothetical protein
MRSHRRGLIKGIILFGQGGRDFHQERNGMNIEALVGQRNDPFKLTDIDFHGRDTVKGVF